MQVHQEKKKAKFRVSFIFLFIIASFAACFAFYMKGDFDASQAVQAGMSTDNSILSLLDFGKNQTAIVNPVQQSEKADASYLNDIVFISNTQMSGMADYGMIQRSKMYLNDNLSISNLNYDELALDEFTAESKDIYIMLGMNDLDTEDTESLFKELGKFIDKVNADGSKTVYLVSLLPVTGKYETENITNAKIDAFNSELLKYANEKNVYYLDINTMFVGNDGKMPESKAENDGYRLKKTSYEEIGEYILTHIATV